MIILKCIEILNRTGHGTTNWFQIGKRVHQGYILSPCLFNLNAAYIMQSVRLKWSEAAQSCPSLCNPMDCSLPASSVNVILQARILEWVAMLSSRGSSLPRDWIWVSWVFCIAGGFFTTQPPGKQETDLLFFNSSVWCWGETQNNPVLVKGPLLYQSVVASPHWEEWESQGKLFSKEVETHLEMGNWCLL